MCQRVKTKRMCVGRVGKHTNRSIGKRQATNQLLHKLQTDMHMLQDDISTFFNVHDFSAHRDYVTYTGISTLSTASNNAMATITTATLLQLRTNSTS